MNTRSEQGNEPKTGASNGAPAVLLSLYASNSSKTHSRKLGIVIVAVGMYCVYGMDSEGGLSPTGLACGIGTALVFIGAAFGEAFGRRKIRAA